MQRRRGEMGKPPAQAAEVGMPDSTATAETMLLDDTEKAARHASETKARRVSSAERKAIKAAVAAATEFKPGSTRPAGMLAGTVDGVVDHLPKKEYGPRTMNDAAIDLNAAADERGVSRKDVLTLIERIAAEAARETTARTKEKPRADWIRARKQGGEVPEFIQRAFARELADDAMHKGLLGRYEDLRRDFYAYQRHHELPAWLKAIPTQKEWADRHPPVAVKPTRPVRPGVPSDEVRRFNREAKRYSRARARQQQAVPGIF